VTLTVKEHIERIVATSRPVVLLSPEAAKEIARWMRECSTHIVSEVPEGNVALVTAPGGRRMVIFGSEKSARAFAVQHDLILRHLS